MGAQSAVDGRGPPEAAPRPFLAGNRVELARSVPRRAGGTPRAQAGRVAINYLCPKAMSYAPHAASC